MTFIDSEVPPLVGEPLDGLLFTCVGVPGHRSVRGGPPGAPTAIRSVQLRVPDEVEDEPPRVFRIYDVSLFLLRRFIKRHDWTRTRRRPLRFLRARV